MSEARKVRIQPRIKRSTWLRVRRKADSWGMTFEDAVEHLLGDALYQLRQEQKAEQRIEREL